MKLKSAFFKFVARFTAGVLILLLGSLLHSLMAPASAQGTAASPLNSETLTQLQSAPATTIRDLTAFSLDFSAAPLVPANLDRSASPNESGRGIIDGDDRLTMTSRSYPWSAIGRIEGITADGEGYICTGALVTPEIVLTNAHCLYNPETHQASRRIRFMPNLINGYLEDEEDIAFVTDAFAGTNFQDRQTPPNPNDWAVLKLDKPLGDKYGTIALAEIPVATLVESYQGKLLLPGYSFDFPPENPSETAGVDEGCSIVSESNGIVVHNCDTRGRSSGGPILAIVNDEVRIVAVNSAEFANQETGVGVENYGVPAPSIVAAIRQQIGQ